MTEPKVFPNPPVIEALLDIQVTPSPNASLSNLSLLHEQIADRFPKMSERMSVSFEFQTNNTAEPAVTSSAGGIDGYIFSSQDGTRVVQARLDGFTFSKLRPYENWATLRNEAREIWSVYLSLTQPVNVKRVALRYINRILLPMPFQDFKEYILTIPEIASGVPQGLDHFLMRLVIPQPDSGAVVILTETTELLKPGDTHLPVIFDIDAFFQDREFVPKSEEVWEALQLLHTVKNSIFFSSITPKTEELFQ